MIDFLVSLAQWASVLLAGLAIIGGTMLAVKWLVGMIILLWEKGP